MDTWEQTHPLLKCIRCEHGWRQGTPRPPKKCPNCQTIHWEKPKMTALSRMGPPPDKLYDLLDPNLIIILRELPHLATLARSAMESLDWIDGHLREGQRAVILSKQKTRQAMDHLEELANATQHLRRKMNIAQEPTQTLDLGSPNEPAAHPDEATTTIPTEPEPEPATPRDRQRVHKSGRKKKAKK